jgi:hypothetical protein
MTRSSSRLRIGKLWLLCGMAIALASGCGYPAAEPENLRLITSLRTALSARNEAWLEANEKMIEQRHIDKVMSDETYEAFKEIIAKAREGDWKGAELESLEFQRAQRPTRQQIEGLPVEKG